jgi:hypothetical protein
LKNNLASTIKLVVVFYLQEEQAMYMYSLENEEFLVTLYWGLEDDHRTLPLAGPLPLELQLMAWRVGGAQKYDPHPFPL